MTTTELRDLAQFTLDRAEDICMQLPSRPCRFENDVCKLAEWVLGNVPAEVVATPTPQHLEVNKDASS